MGMMMIMVWMMRFRASDYLRVGLLPFNSHSDKAKGIQDLIKFRYTGNIAEEVFDLEDPEKGKVSAPPHFLFRKPCRTMNLTVIFFPTQILRIKANDREEVKSYVNEFASVRQGAVDVLILRTKSTCVWDFSFF